MQSGWYRCGAVTTCGQRTCVSVCLRCLRRHGRKLSTCCPVSASHVPVCKQPGTVYLCAAWYSAVSVWYTDPVCCLVHWYSIPGTWYNISVCSLVHWYSVPMQTHAIHSKLLLLPSLPFPFLNFFSTPLHGIWDKLWSMVFPHGALENAP